MITDDELRSAIAAIIDPHAFAPIRDDVEEPFRGMIEDDRKLALSRATRITELLASRANAAGVSEAMVEAAQVQTMNGRRVAVPQAAIDWLMGEGADPAGLGFGDFPEDHPQPPGTFWWRTTFRDICAYFAPSTAAQGKAEPVGDWQRTVKYLLARCEDYDGTRMSDGAEPMGVTCATLRGAAKAIEGLAATVSHQHEVVVLEREARIKAEAALTHPSPPSISAGRDEGLEAAKIAEGMLEVIPMWERPGGPPGNGPKRLATPTEIAAAIRKEIGK